MNQAKKKKIEEKRKLKSELAISEVKELSSTDELSKNSDCSDETMIISGFDDEEPEKEAVIKINKKK